jgi:hypothetical protein
MPFFGLAGEFASNLRLNLPFLSVESWRNVGGVAATPQVNVVNST